MGLSRDVLSEISQAGDGDLGRLEGFVNGGDQDEVNDLARSAIKQRRAELASQKAAGQLATQANEYQANAGAQKEGLYGQVAGQARRSLAQDLAGQQWGASQHGRLYSGLLEEQQGASRAHAATGLVEARKNINEAVDENARKMQGNAAKAAAGLQIDQIATQEDIMNQALQNVLSKQQAISALGQAAGQIGGAAYARASGGPK